MRRKVARKRTYDEVLPSKEYELSVPLDGSSYQVRENLQDILVRELCGPSDGDDELEAVPERMRPWLEALESYLAD